MTSETVRPLDMLIIKMLFTELWINQIGELIFAIVVSFLWSEGVIMSKSH